MRLSAQTAGQREEGFSTDQGLERSLRHVIRVAPLPNRSSAFCAAGLPSRLSGKEARPFSQEKAAPVCG